MEAFVALVALAWLGLSIWLVVIAVRFLRSGRKAFDRYMALTNDQAVAMRALARAHEPGQHRVDTAPPAPPAVKW